MNFDEQKLKRLDNTRLNDNQYENVIILTQKRIQKGEFLLAFFFIKQIIFSFLKFLITLKINP